MELRGAVRFGRSFYCPVCRTEIISHGFALRALAVAQGIPLEISWRKMRRRLAELARTDIHREMVVVEHRHRGGNDRECVCLIIIDDHGKIGTASYAPLGAAQEVR